LKLIYFKKTPKTQNQKQKFFCFFGFFLFAFIMKSTPSAIHTYASPLPSGIYTRGKVLNPLSRPLNLFLPQQAQHLVAMLHCPPHAKQLSPHE
jgi:hypothetical protein